MSGPQTLQVHTAAGPQGAWADIAATLGLMFWELRLLPGRLEVALSPALRAYLGGEDDDADLFVGWLEGIHPQDHERFRTHLAAAATDGCSEIEYRATGRGRGFTWLRSQVGAAEREPHLVLCGALTDVTSQHRSRPSPPAADGRLTERQLQILRLVAEGATAREVAGMLNLSAHTVRTHVARSQRALGVRRSSDAVARAREQGLLP
jgi:DNA-binding CsgD family transcriptional regulator